MQLHINKVQNYYEVSINFKMSKLLITYRINLLCEQKVNV